jgi:TPR repeat protein
MRAAEAGHVGAQFSLGNCFRDGKGVAVDAAAAVKWFTCAADAGSSYAMTNLAVCYSNGTGDAVDFAKSIALMTRAAEAGNAVAQYNLGLRFRDGSLGVTRDLVMACEWFSRSAAGGDADAAAELAALDAAAPP